MPDRGNDLSADTRRTARGAASAFVGHARAITVIAGTNSDLHTVTTPSPRSILMPVRGNDLSADTRRTARGAAPACVGHARAVTATAGINSVLHVVTKPSPGSISMPVHGNNLSVGTRRTVSGCSMETATQAESDDDTSASDNQHHSAHPCEAVDWVRCRQSHASQQHGSGQGGGANMAAATEPTPTKTCRGGAACMRKCAYAHPSSVQKWFATRCWQRTGSDSSMTQRLMLAVTWTT